MQLSCFQSNHPSVKLLSDKDIFSGYNHGGGGGGIVVNGIRPGTDTNKGEGFGGGAYGASGNVDGYPGCVLIET